MLKTSEQTLTLGSDVRVGDNVKSTHGTENDKNLSHASSCDVDEDSKETRESMGQSNESKLAGENVDGTHTNDDEFRTMAPAPIIAPSPLDDGGSNGTDHPTDESHLDGAQNSHASMQNNLGDRVQEDDVKVVGLSMPSNYGNPSERRVIQGISMDEKQVSESGQSHAVKCMSDGPSDSTALAEIETGAQSTRHQPCEEHHCEEQGIREKGVCSPTSSTCDHNFSHVADHPKTDEYTEKLENGRDEAEALQQQKKLESGGCESEEAGNKSAERNTTLDEGKEGGVAQHHEDNVVKLVNRTTASDVEDQNSKENSEKSGKEPLPESRIVKIRWKDSIAQVRTFDKDMEPVRLVRGVISCLIGAAFRFRAPPSLKKQLQHTKGLPPYGLPTWRDLAEPKSRRTKRQVPANRRDSTVLLRRSSRLRAAAKQVPFFRGRCEEPPTEDKSTEEHSNIEPIDESANTAPKSPPKKDLKKVTRSGRKY